MCGASVIGCVTQVYALRKTPKSMYSALHDSEAGCLQHKPWRCCLLDDAVRSAGLGLAARGREISHKRRHPQDPVRNWAGNEVEMSIWPVPMDAGQIDHMFAHERWDADDWWNTVAHRTPIAPGVEGGDTSSENAPLHLGMP